MKDTTRLDVLTFASHGFSGGWSLCQPACVHGRTSDRTCTGKRVPSRTIKVGICSLGEHQESPEVRWPRLWGLAAVSSHRGGEELHRLKGTAGTRGV